MKQFLFALSLLGILECSLVFSKPPQSLKFNPLQFVPPQAERRVLSGGTTLFMLVDSELPIVNVSAQVRTGSMYESGNKVGLAALCGTMMRAGGTKSMRVEAINEELEFLGASVETGMDTESASASLSVLKKDLSRGLEIFADILINPAFVRQKTEIEKAKIIESIRRRNDQPFQIARREFRKLMYGDRHPLSRTREIPTIKKISRSDLLAFHEKYFYPQNMMIAVSGDFDPDELAAKLETLFQEWENRIAVWPKVRTLDSASKDIPAKERRVRHAEKDLSQSSILLGHLGIKRHNPDRFVLEVMNEILGGSAFSSRLYKNVRSRQGLAYWVGSSISEPWDYGTIAAGCQTKNKTVGRTIQAILDEIREIRTEKVSDDELSLAKNSIVNSFVFRYASSHAIATQKMSLEYFGYPEDYLETYTQKISAVTAEDVLKIADKYLKPEAIGFVIVGSSKDFDLSLDSLGSVRGVDLTIPE